MSNSGHPKNSKRVLKTQNAGLTESLERLSTGLRINRGKDNPAGLLARIGAYVALTKPRIIELLLVTTVPAMILADRAWPGTWVVAATRIGGTLNLGYPEQVWPDHCASVGFRAGANRTIE